jgi:hypothetical protein
MHLFKFHSPSVILLCTFGWLVLLRLGFASRQFLFTCHRNPVHWFMYGIDLHPLAGTGERSGDVW